MYASPAFGIGCEDRAEVPGHDKSNGTIAAKINAIFMLNRLHGFIPTGNMRVQPVSGMASQFLFDVITHTNSPLPFAARS
ncbi:MAG: hypothetical protein EOO82_03245 [Oxalobacteraceae bacterium]|nr:MAG: hypothetical protein EOO82_03245 [Oxalobacteraceae bacterium]